ncbi:hypothetical protein J6590_078479 [Homalodisca vitripennis]|nr:hypothetical protein J6590_078479 [Homalodisca vitripennis]
MTSFQWEMAVAAFHTIPSYTIGGYRDWMDTSSSWRSGLVTTCDVTLNLSRAWSLRHGWYKVNISLSC